MKGTWETTDGADLGQLVPVLGALAALGAVVWLVVTFIWVIAAILGVAAAASAAVLVWLARHGADVATVQRSALPAPEATPLPSRTSQAPPAPQELHLHLHGLTPAQIAEVAAIQQAGRNASVTSRNGYGRLHLSQHETSEAARRADALVP